MAQQHPDHIIQAYWVNPLDENCENDWQEIYDLLKQELNNTSILRNQFRRKH
ncbi:MAG: hypothetical protein LBU90_02465 [Bacteroidales bacterium]|jgi:hypothetical protein|nr:hypothetical protein [Bacteroidales bacterium]